VHLAADPAPGRGARGLDGEPLGQPQHVRQALHVPVALQAHMCFVGSWQQIKRDVCELDSVCVEPFVHMLVRFICRRTSRQWVTDRCLCFFEQAVGDWPLPLFEHIGSVHSLVLECLLLERWMVESAGRSSRGCSGVSTAVRGIHLPQ